MYREFLPKSFLYLRSGYTRSTFKKDLLAGITIGIIALPLAIAFAIASGTTPERGLITAIIAGFLISALGGSRVQIGGPTGAFVVLIYDIIQRNGYEGLVLATLIGAILLILFGVFRLGTWIKYVPHPLVVGFTTGIAFIIFSSQIKEFFGLSQAGFSPDFLGKWSSYIQTFPSLHGPTCALGTATLLCIFLIRRYTPRIPWGITAIGLATACVYLFDLPVATLHSAFGELPHSIPLPSLPSFLIPEGKFVEIFMDAVAIALLGGIESLLSAVIGDGMMGGRHKSNCELVGQGIANIGSILFGGIPATGAIARTATNVKAGAQTPVAGMIHALTLLLIVLFFSPLVSHIPLSALAAVLIMIAWNMSELSHFIHLLKAPLGDVAILLTSFFLTLFVDITAAIVVGMILSSFLFMKRMSQFSKVQLSSAFHESKVEFHPDTRKYLVKGVEIYEIQGPFFFGAADILKDLLVNIEPPPKVFILRLRQASFIDASGMCALKEFHEKCKKEKITLLLAEVEGHVKADLKKFGLTQLIGKKQIFPSLDLALKAASQCT